MEPYASRLKSGEPAETVLLDFAEDICRRLDILARPSPEPPIHLPTLEKRVAVLEAKAGVDPDWDSDYGPCPLCGHNAQDD